VDLNVIARGSHRFAGADLANLVNEAALLAARHNRKVVTMWDFENAKDKVLMGAERRSLQVTEAIKRATAYHEAGHALVGLLTPGAMPLHKVTVIPRGMSLGLTKFLPQGDMLNMTKTEAEAQIAMCMGGRVADEIFNHHQDTGAKMDIDQATEIARSMVCEWGMSDLGPLSYGKREEQIFIGREIAQHRDYSEATAMKIDEAIRALVDQGYERAKKLIEANQEAMVRIAEALVEREVLDASEVRQLIEGTTPLAKLEGSKPPSGDPQIVKPEPTPGGGPRPIIGPQPA
jgi:cell division protease FtsH